VSRSLSLAETRSDVPARISTVLDIDAAFREHYAFIWRALVCLGVSKADADDVAQEVFVVAHRRRDVFDGRATARAWLYGVARKLARNHRRRSGDGRWQGVTTDPIAIAGDPEQNATQQQALDLVQRCLGRMSPKLRDALVLADIEGLTAPEVATCLGIGINTAYSRIRLARARLDELLAEQLTREPGGRR